MFELSNLDSIQIGMASPEQILAWSHGEVTKPETINYRTLKPERDGLYCERIFGPTKDWECNCGKYKRIKFKDKDKICDKCGVQVTRAKVRRERMGHIQLAAPVSHIWYFKGIPSRMGMLLDISPRNLEKVLYFANFIVLDPGNSEETGLKRLELINDARYREIEAKCGKGSFVAKMGAEAIRDLLMELDLDKMSAELKAEIAQLTEKERDRETEGQKRARAVKRLEVVRHVRPERPVPPGHQPEQPPEETAGAGRAGHHRPERKAHAAGVCGRPDRQRPARPPRDGSRKPGAEIPERSAARQAGPVPPEPAGQARGLFRPQRYRRRS